MLHMTVVLAQQVTISGQVLDEKSEPLIGATVNIEGTTNAVITDLEGKFTLKALPSEKIVISYLGYKPKTVAIGKNRKFNITLDPSVTEMDEVVVVGYGSQRKSDIATAVASVNIKDIADYYEINIRGSLPKAVRRKPCKHYKAKSAVCRLSRQTVRYRAE